VNSQLSGNIYGGYIYGDIYGGWGVPVTIIYWLHENDFSQNPNSNSE
jgi:hypothetical protein